MVKSFAEAAKKNYASRKIQWWEGKITEKQLGKPYSLMEDFEILVDVGNYIESLKNPTSAWNELEKEGFYGLRREYLNLVGKF